MNTGSFATRNIDASRGTVLVIDDTPINQDILTDILGNEGYTLRFAPDGESGLDQARQLKPDLVLLDLVLPGLMGTDVLAILKQELPETMVILTTAYGSEETAIKALRAGVNDYIINKRPFDPTRSAKSSSAQSRKRSCAGRTNASNVKWNSRTNTCAKLCRTTGCLRTSQGIGQGKSSLLFRWSLMTCAIPLLSPKDILN